MTHNNQENRRRLFQRLEGDLPPLSLTERDVRILHTLYDYRFMTQPLVRALIGGSDRYLTERLSRLFHHGYVDRPKQQLALRIFGMRHIIYALSRQGAKFLACYHQDDRYLRPRWTDNNKAVQAPQFLHTLMIATARVCLTTACKGRWDVTLKAWESPEGSLARYVMNGQRVCVNPDGYFVLKFASGEEAHFYLEADRGTATYGSIRNKLSAYWRMRSERHLVPDRVPPAYRVLTVSPSRERCERMIEVGRQADTRQVGSRMFYFCSEEDYDLARPQSILEPIWRTPADGRGVRRSLLERKGGTHDLR